MAKMIKDTRTGKFISRAPDPDNDWKREPLRWEHIAPDPAPTKPEAVHASEVDLELTNNRGERVQVIAPLQGRKGSGWQPVAGGRKNAPAGQHKGTCSKCRGELENPRQRYCRACAAAANRASRERKKAR